MTDLKIGTLTCEYRINPLGIDIKKPRIRWKIQSDRRGTQQKAYQVQVALIRDNFTDLLWDSGIVASDQSIHIEYGGSEPPGIFAMKTKTLKELADFPESNLSIEKVNALIEELNKIEWNAVLVQH